MHVYIITALILIFYLVLAWIAGSLLQLHGASLWILRGSLALIGIVAAGFFLWFHKRSKRGQSVGPGSAAAVDEINIRLRQAGQTLSRSKRGSLRTLPVIFVLGELNSAKTSIILHSGLKPEWLAGHVQRDGDVVPTSTINIWLAQNTVLIEAGGKLASDPQLWKHLLYHTRPKRFAAALGKGEQAPRAVLACIDCEHLGAEQNSAQKLSSRLKEMGQSLGATFPVYVLFTKLDRIPYFSDFVGRLASTESAEILGATLPRVNIDGVFADQESSRLGKVFDQLIYSLAEKRIDYLSRETAAERIPGIYEFPRELRKIRNQIIQLLLEISSPSQLSANPFLRGLYFCGVRAVIVNEAVPVLAATQKAKASGGSGATRIFQHDDALHSAESAPLRTVQSRKIPEWTFLPHLFSEIILRDRVAFSSSHRSTRVDKLRRALLACVVMVLLFFAGAFVVSFTNNRMLEREVEAAATNLTASSRRSADFPDREQLASLEQLRISLAQLAQYQMDGPPTSHRFGLYIGDRIYPAGRSIYFQNFRRMLLASAQARMDSVLKQPPGTHSIDDFQQMYSTLKAYLITTSNHEHADWNSLVAMLLSYSPVAKDADAETKDLIRRQFAFYAQELMAENPFEPGNDREAVEHARAYLGPFDATEAIYQAMLDEAGKAGRPVNFNRLYPGSAQFVLDSHEVPAGFTKEAFNAMQKLLQDPDRLRGEKWVLGTSANVNTTVESLRETLTRRYWSDYMYQWRAYLKAARVVPYNTLSEGLPKLTKLTANDSPLLQLLWLAKENTLVDIPDIKNSFDAVQSTMRDSSREKMVGAGNQDYMDKLGQLQNSMHNIVTVPNGLSDAGMLAQVQQAASNATGTVTQIRQHFTVDSHEDGVDKNVSRLLEEPIDSANQAAARAGGAAAEAICTTVNSITGKKPFNSRASLQATLQEVQDLFRPQTGTLWSSVLGKLGTAVARQGTAWVNVGPPPQSANFLVFLNRAQQFTETLFPNGSPSIRLSYTLRGLQSNGVDQAVLTIDGQIVGDVGHSHQLIWLGADSTISLTVTTLGQKITPVTAQGTWALFEFFREADWNGNNPAILEWPLESQTQFAHRRVGETSKAAVRYELTTQGTQVFRPEFLKGLHCSAR